MPPRNDQPVRRGKQKLDAGKRARSFCGGLLYASDWLRKWRTNEAITKVKTRAGATHKTENSHLKIRQRMSPNTDTLFYQKHKQLQAHKHHLCRYVAVFCDPFHCYQVSFKFTRHSNHPIEFIGDLKMRSKMEQKEAITGRHLRLANTIALSRICQGYPRQPIPIVTLRLNYHVLLFANIVSHNKVLNRGRLEISTTGQRNHKDTIFSSVISKVLQCDSVLDRTQIIYNYPPKGR